MRPVIAALLSGFLSLPAWACDLALVLALDVSGSVDHEEYRIQADGLATALRDGAVSDALIVAKARVAVVQWSGSGRQELTLDWVALEARSDVVALAARIETMPRPWRDYSTAVGQALEFSALQFGDVSDCRRRVIDVSGDGESNEGLAPEALHPDLRALGVTVNALAIEESEEGLTAWFRERVITGPGAFAVRANTFADYPARIRLKLLREVVVQISGMPRSVCDHSVWTCDHIVKE